MYDRAVVELRGAAAITNFPVEVDAAKQSQQTDVLQHQVASSPKPQESAEDLLARVVLAATLAQRAQPKQTPRSPR